MPKVSVVLPTYNRANMIQRTLSSIQNQTYKNWELVIVDDGSTDETKDVIEHFAQSICQDVLYIHQENQGAGPARNNGISNSRTDLIAFIDSDDVWLTHHLQDCVKALTENPEIDWICSDLSRVEIGTGKIIVKSKFHTGNDNPKFFDLKHRNVNGVKIIRDKRLARFLLRFGNLGSLQCSVLRRKIFDHIKWRDFKIGEDRLLGIEAAKCGFVFAYIDNIHVHFGIHDAHSTAGRNASAQKYIDTYNDLARMFRYIYTNDSFSFREKISARKSSSHEYFWGLAYNGLWLNGKRIDSTYYFLVAIRIWPFSLSYWKTFLVCFGKLLLSGEMTQIRRSFISGQPF